MAEEYFQQVSSLGFRASLYSVHRSVLDQHFFVRELCRPLKVSYALMLAAMTYNTWVLVSLGAGFATGYLFFGWFKPRKTAVGEEKELLGENEHDPCCN